jgi:predicted MFS family arabinose efflux permease
MLVLFIFGAMEVFFAITLGLQREGVSAPQLGVMQTVFGVAGIMGAMAAGPLLKKVSIGHALIAGLVILLGALGSQLFSHPYSHTLFVVGATGCVFPVINVGILSFVMAITPPDKQGRVNSILGVLQLAINPLVSALAGFLAQSTSWVVSLAPGLIALAAAAALAFASARIRGLPRTSDLGDLAAVS